MKIVEKSTTLQSLKVGDVFRHNGEIWMLTGSVALPEGKGFNSINLETAKVMWLEPEVYVTPLDAVLTVTGGAEDE